MKDAPEYFDAESPPRIYGNNALSKANEDIPPTFTLRHVRESEIGLSTRTALVVFVLVMGGVFLAINGPTMIKCMDENVECEWE